MARNPFYTGYIPGDENDPLYKIRPKRVKPGTPVNFGFNFETQLVQELEHEADIPAKVKEYIIDAEVDEIKSAFKVSAGIGKKSSLSNQKLNDIQRTGEEPELPGAMGLSVNLIDLVTNPQETVAKVLTEGWKNITSWEEFDQNLSHRAFARILMDKDAPIDEENGPNTGKELEPRLPLQKLAEDTYTRGTINLSGIELPDYSDQGQKNPLQMWSDNKSGFRRGRGRFFEIKYKNYDGDEVTEKVGMETMYKEVADKASKFVMTSKSASSRDSAYEDYLATLQKVLTKELDQWDGTLTDDMKERLKKAAAINPALAIPEDKVVEVLKQARSNFVNKGGLINAVRDLGGDEDSGLGGLSSQLSRFVVEGRTDNTASEMEKTIAGIGSAIKTSEKKIDTLRNALSGEALSTFNKQIRPYEELLTQIKGTVFDVKEGETLAVFNATTASPNVRRLLNNIKSGVAGLGDKADATSILTTINFVTSGGLDPTKSPLTNGTVVNQSLLFKLQRDLIEGGFDRSIGAREMVHLDDIGVLTDIMGVEDANALKVLTKRLQNMREWDAFREALQNFDGGKLWRNYYYVKRIRDNLTILTPSYWVNHALKRVQYFGFKIDEKNLAKSPKLIQYLITGSPLSALFVNRFSLNITFVGAGKTKVKLEGGKHFNGVTSLYSLYSSEKLSKAELKSFLSFIAFDAKALYKDPAKKIMNADWVEWHKKLTDVFKDKDKAQKFLEDIQGFTTWLQTKGKSIVGEKVLRDAENLFKLLGALVNHESKAGTSSITTTFLGVIDKVAIQFNKVQSYLLNKFGKWLAPISYLKQAIAEGVTDALMGILAAITGGLSATATPIIKWVLQWTVVKTLDFFEKIIQGISKGDLSFIFKGYEKTLTRIFKYVMYASIVPFTCMLLVLFVFNVLLSSINPVNVARNTVSSAFSSVTGSFFTGAVGAIVGALFDGGSDGHYLSQRDAAWATVLIGASGLTLYEVGCLIVSVAMVYSYYGINISPVEIALNAANFAGNSALLYMPSIGGHTWATATSIAGEIAAGNPVILGINTGPWGTHFVVAIGMDSNGCPIIHDPWIGPDRNYCTEYGSMSKIFTTRVLR